MANTNGDAGNEEIGPETVANEAFSGTGGAETKRVRVSYRSEGAGLALSLADSVDVTDGVLRITDACVTLEIPTTDGRPSMLAWDPAEVSWDAVGLAAAS